MTLTSRASWGSHLARLSPHMIGGTVLSVRGGVDLNPNQDPTAPPACIWSAAVDKLNAQFLVVWRSDA